MSTSPGVTYSPETSTTLSAPAGSMPAATAATLPAAIATSRTAVIPFLGSMTCPPFNSRSYFGCAGGWPIAAGTTQAPTANASPSERAIANEPRERSAPAKRRARERVGESEGRSPSERLEPDKPFAADPGELDLLAAQHGHGRVAGDLHVLGTARRNRQHGGRGVPLLGAAP